MCFLQTYTCLHVCTETGACPHTVRNVSCVYVCVLSTVQYSRDACSPLLYLCLQFCFLRMYCCWLHGCMFFFLHSYVLQIVCCKSRMMLVMSPDSGFSEAPWFGFGEGCLGESRPGTACEGVKRPDDRSFVTFTLS